MKVALRIASGPAAPNDSVILGRIAEGDLAALGVLYDRYAGCMLGFARRLARDRDAEDIVQTVFLRVVRIAKNFDPMAPSARPWLFAVTARVAQERQRALRRWAAALLRHAELPDRRTSTISETRPDVEQSLAQLSPAKRIVLVLAEVEGFACEEIAQMLAIPIGTVWTRLHHARREMRSFHEAEQP